MRIVAVVIGAVIALSLLWSAGELHYRDCVDAAKARTVEVPVGRSGEVTVFGRGSLELLTARSNAVEGCSRLPF